ncbi:hypothetical protein [Piscinibacter sp. XHJ-5]|uniref:hypothetical protein n=1 Tax=Piscinibacter sp. XHJ-5 TaxID=3037797 RepID=UPI002452E7C2|nr:hypothetical protein [Piscinibacter sp. XHJ-5]
MNASTRLSIALVTAGLLACGGGGGGSPAPEPPVIVPVDGPAWWGFGRNAQHSAQSDIAAQPLARIHWQAPLDLAPQQTNGALLIHYGSPVITRHNTVVMPVKTGATGGFRVEARIGQTGAAIWTMDSDYRLPAPAPSWIPSFNPTLVPSGRLYVPAAGGRLIVRDDPDSATGATSTVAFHGSACNAPPVPCNDTVFISTPLTADGNGNVYFGFNAGANAPAALAGGGFARVAADRSATFVRAAVAAGDAAMVKPQTNSAPALSADGATLYVVVNNIPAAGTRARGMLLALDATTLATRAARSLLDPASGSTPAWVNDNATSSPTVGPDGDVYVGVLESAGAPHNFRGWLLHFDATLAQSKTPASFGWDITASVVPRAMVPQYAGQSSYLLAIKYNNYYNASNPASRDGRNEIAIVDPHDTTRLDPVNGTTVVMGEVLKKLGPTRDPAAPAPAVKEWCINTMAVDPASSAVLVNSEDGILYRWHLPSDSFSEQIRLTAGLLEAYTPTAIGADGRVYAVNDATLFSIGQ